MANTNNPYCQNLTAPINITHNVEVCSSTCSLELNYLQTGINYQNMDSYINVVPEGANSNNKQVKFNGNDYEFSSLRIYSPSIHQFMGEYLPGGEIVIIHKNIENQNKLLIICIPIKVVNNKSLANPILENIIQLVNVNANRTTLSTSNSDGSDSISPLFSTNTVAFNLENIVPKTAFYWYDGIFSFQKKISNSCNNSQILVFSPEESSIAISSYFQSVLSALIVKVNPNEYKISPNTSLYFNEKGVSNKGSGEIYIDCQPVNRSTDEVFVPLNSGQNQENINNLLNDLTKLGDNPLSNTLIGVMLMLGLYFVIDNAFKIFGGIRKS